MPFSVDKATISHLKEKGRASGVRVQGQIGDRSEKERVIIKRYCLGIHHLRNTRPWKELHVSVIRTTRRHFQTPDAISRPNQKMTRSCRNTNTETSHQERTQSFVEVSSSTLVPPTRSLRAVLSTTTTAWLTKHL